MSAGSASRRCARSWRRRRASSAPCGTSPSAVPATEDAATLERWLNERPAPTPERLRTLTAERMTRLQAVLREQHGIPSERVVRRDPSADVAEGAPAVRFEIGAAIAVASAQ